MPDSKSELSAETIKNKTAAFLFQPATKGVQDIYFLCMRYPLEFRLPLQLAHSPTSVALAS